MFTPDDEIRAAAGASIQNLVRDRGTNILKWADIAAGFEFKGTRIHYATQAAGIFKPKEISDGAALSIKQVSPSRLGRSAPYDDKDLGEGLIAYKLQRAGDASVFNQYLINAHKTSVPLIFLRGIADALYEVLYPVFVQSIDHTEMIALITLDQAPDETAARDERLSEPIQRGYSVGVRKTRLHQQAFRQRVLYAYGLRCALTGLPVTDLLDAAHIISDSEDGEASVRNGIAMSKIHHAAYERNLLGIDPDGKIHLSDQLRETRDGPMFEHGILKLHNETIHLPVFEGHRPNKDFLALKFDQFTRK